MQHTERHGKTIQSKITQHLLCFGQGQEKPSILLTGGVAANIRLQEMLKTIADENSVKFYVVTSKLAGDNGVMIAWTGLLHHRHGMKLKIEDSKIRPKWRLDEIEIPW